MTIPMTVIQKNRNGVTEFVAIDLQDVDFVETRDRRIVYHIGENEYYQATTKSELEDLLLEEGFDQLDRPFLVNMKKIRNYCKEYGKVYFVDEPTSTSKFATVARIKEDLVEKFIRYFVHKNQDTMSEISLEKNTPMNKWKTFLSKGHF